MKRFDFIVGNPPYQEQGNNNKLYPSFYLESQKVSECVEMIFPIAWQEPKNTNGLQKMNKAEVKQDNQIILIDNRHNVFNGVSGAEWTNIILWKNGYDNGLDGKQKIFIEGKDQRIIMLLTNNKDIKKPNELVRLAEIVMSQDEFVSMKENISPRKPYGLATDIADNEVKYGLAPMQKQREKDTDLLLICKKGVIRYMPFNYQLPRETTAKNKYKVFLPNAWGNMSKGYIGGAYADIIISNPKEICSETYLETCGFDTFDEAKKCAKYLMTRFCRALLYINKFSLLCSTSWGAVPQQDYHEEWWSKSIAEIDKELMKKYNVPQDIRDFVFANIQQRTEENIINYR